LLRSIRSPLYITSVIADYNLKDYPVSSKLVLQVLVTYMKKIFSKEDLASWKWLFSILGPQSGFWNLRKDSNLDIKSMEAIFKDFLQLVGVSMSDVTMEYYHILTKKTWTPIRSIGDLWFDFKKMINLCLRP